MTHAWTDFFSALARVRGALVGLIFVALTFKPKMLVRSGDPRMGALASWTFADFLLLLLISVAMLAPQMLASNVGAIFLLIVVIDLARMLRSFF